MRTVGTKNINVDLPEDLWRGIRVVAAAEDKDIRTIVSEAVQEKLARYKGGMISIFGKVGSATASPDPDSSDSDSSESMESEES